MATNYIQPGAILTLTAPYDRLSGEGAQVGSIFGVATSDVDSGDPGEFDTEGVWSLAKTSAQAWTVGQKIYWDNGNKRCDSDGTVGMLIGVATAAATNPSSTGYVKLNSSAPSSSEGPQAAEADLTDNSGGAAADGTIGVVTAPTAIAATLTDSSGYSGTHNDTVAAMAAIAALTENGGALGGVQDGNIAALVDPAGDAGASLIDGVREVAAKVNALAAAEAVHAQNISDVAQKIIELVTAQGEDRTAIVALTDAIKELSTKLNALLAKLRLAGVISA